MQRLRGFFLGLALSTLVGLSGSQAEAGNITISVYLGSTSNPALATFTGSTTSLTVTNLTILNGKLAAAGSIYTVDGLTASSNNGLGQSPGFLHDSATVTEVAGSNGAKIIVVASQSGFLTPSPGSKDVSLLSTAAYNGSPAAGGSATYVSAYQSSSAPTITLTPTSSNSPTTLSGLGTIPSGGYMLTDTTSIGYTGTGNSETVTATGSITAMAIPEPSSVVMFLTGMPLPLAIVFGLIRRRRTAA